MRDQRSFHTGYEDQSMDCEFKQIEMDPSVQDQGQHNLLVSTNRYT